MKSLKNLIKKLKKANEDYHEVIDEILELPDLNVVFKANIGNKAKAIFDRMTDLNNYLDIIQ